MTSVRDRRPSGRTCRSAPRAEARGRSACSTCSALSTGVSTRVRMQKVAVGWSPNWAFSRMFPSSSSRPSAMLATIPGRSGQASVRMWTATSVLVEASSTVSVPSSVVDPARVPLHPGEVMTSHPLLVMLASFDRGEGPMAAEMSRQRAERIKTEYRQGPSGWADWIIFAAVMLIIVGVLNAIHGFVAIVNDEWVVWTNRADLYLDLTTWGWVHIAIGIALVLTGLGVLKGNVLARTIAV